MTSNLKVLPFLSLLRRGVTIDVHADGGEERFSYYTTTEILDSDPDGDGGVVLALDATIFDGELRFPASVIDTAEEGSGGWEIRHAGLVFLFDTAESSSLFDADGRRMLSDAEWEPHVQAVRERDATREAKLREQKGRQP